MMKIESKAVKHLFFNPFFTMFVVIVVNLVKSSAKITVGLMVKSPTLVEDGSHNLLDILEGFAVLVAMYVAGRRCDSTYPLGKLNIETLVSLFIGIGLMVLSVLFAAWNIAGVLSHFPDMDVLVRSYIWLPIHTPIIIDPVVLPYLLAVTAGSIVASFILARYEKSVGRAQCRPSLIADGEETQSDARIELVTFLAVVAEYFLGWAWVEYPFGLIVVGLIAYAGVGLVKQNSRILLQRNIGDDHEKRISQLCMSTAGVDGIGSLMTFQVGQKAVVILRLLSRGSAQTEAYIKYAVRAALRSYLLSTGDFKDCVLSVDCQQPKPKRYRVAYASTGGLDWLVAGTVEESVEIVLCDVEMKPDANLDDALTACDVPEYMEVKVYTKYEAMPPFDELVEYLHNKHVLKLFVFTPTDRCRQLAGTFTSVLPTISVVPEALGLR